MFEQTSNRHTRLTIARLTILSTCLILMMGFGLIAGRASAAPIFDTFGPLDAATFGGTGIPNQEVAVSTQFVDGDVLVTVAMSATQRFFNPALTNDGAGTYFAETGSNFGGPGSMSTFEGALWNFNYYINVESTAGGSPVLADYQIDLFYDFDTGVDTAIGSLGVIDVTAGLLASPATAGLTLLEDSQNLMFGYLGITLPGFLTAPAGSFDPNATGEYNFAIQVSRPGGGFGIETVAMDVTVIPEPTTALLLGVGLFGLILSRRN